MTHQQRIQKGKRVSNELGLPALSDLGDPAPTVKKPAAKKKPAKKKTTAKKKTVKA